MPTAVFDRKGTSSRKHAMDPRGWSRGFPHASKTGYSIVSSLARERALRKGGLSRVPKIPSSRQHEVTMMQSWQVRAEVLQTENRILWDVVMDLQNHLPPGVMQASLRSVLAREEAVEATKRARLEMESLRHYSMGIPCPSGSPPPSPPLSPTIDGSSTQRTTRAYKKSSDALSETPTDSNNKRPLVGASIEEEEKLFKSQRLSKGDSPSSNSRE